METIPGIAGTALKGQTLLNRIQRGGGAPSQPATSKESSEVAATPENMRKVQMAVEALDIFMEKQPDTRFHFQVHDDSGKIQVQLVNFRTGEVVEEIPSKKLLDFTAQLEQLTGLVLEKHA